MNGKGNEHLVNIISDEPNEHGNNFTCVASMVPKNSWLHHWLLGAEGRENLTSATKALLEEALVMLTQERTRNVELLASTLPYLVRYWYEHPNHSTGGILHLVLDDGNFDDESLEFCRDLAKKDTSLSAPLARLILDILTLFPPEERDKRTTIDPSTRLAR